MQVKFFRGSASYYQFYVQGFASIARPLHKSCETLSVVHWTDQSQRSFDSLKTSLATTPILAFPSLQKPSYTQTQANSLWERCWHQSMMVANEAYAMRPRHFHNLKASVRQHAVNFWQL